MESESEARRNKFSIFSYLRATIPTRQRLAHTVYSLPVCMACLSKQQQALLAMLPVLTREAPSYLAMQPSGRVHAGQLAVLHSTSAWWACCALRAGVPCALA